MFVKGQTEKQNKTDQAMVIASIASCFKVILDVSKKTILGFYEYRYNNISMQPINQRFITLRAR